MFEEPGEDSTKFDVIAPNVVHPKKPDIVNVSAAYDSSEVRFGLFYAKYSHVNTRTVLSFFFIYNG
jgi:hypothetical protein